MSEQQTPALEKAFLDMPAMIAIVRRLFDEIEEPRSRKRPTHSLTDCLASCMAMFHFRDGSMLQFEKASKIDSRQRNLRLMYQLNGDAPSDTSGVGDWTRWIRTEFGSRFRCPASGQGARHAEAVQVPRRSCCGLRDRTIENIALKGARAHCTSENRTSLLPRASCRSATADCATCSLPSTCRDTRRSDPDCGS